jgi:hypothetical protein
MKRSRMKPRSKKMSKVYVERRKLVEKLLKEHPQCEAQVPDVCTGKSVDLHELLARSQGGSILDPSNIICVCRACHDFIGREVKLATEMGLRRRRYVLE